MAEDHYCVLFDDGRIKCWGENDDGVKCWGANDDCAAGLASVSTFGGEVGDKPEHQGDALPFLELKEDFVPVDLVGGTQVDFPLVRGKVRCNMLYSNSSAWRRSTAALLSIASLLLLGVIVEGCESNGTGTDDDAQGGAAGATSTDPAEGGAAGATSTDPAEGGAAGATSTDPCFPGIGATRSLLQNEEGKNLYGSYALTEDGFVHVERAEETDGYRVGEFDSQGKLGAMETLWPEVPAGEERIAVSKNVLAIVDVAAEGKFNRSTCRLALVELGSLDSLLEPTRVSDSIGSGETVLNEVDGCDVASTSDGFVVVWTQLMSDRSLEYSLFLQRYDRKGDPQGDRETLAVGDKGVRSPSLASDGEVAVVVQGDGESALATFVEPDGLREVDLEGVTFVPAPPRVLLTDAGLLVYDWQQLVLLDRSGKRLAGPSDEGSPLFAPLSGGYVVVDDEEFEGEERRLVARSLDATLSRPSAPSGLSFDRRARGNQLLSTPDGKRVLFLYTEEDKLYGAPLECSSEPGPLERPTCPEMDRLTPLDPGCREEVCHVIVRLDASTLGVKAHALREGSLEPVDIDEAEDIAVSFLEEHDVDVFDDPSMTGPNAGTFMALVEPSDFGSFVLVGQDSGQVVTAGEVVYAGRGYYWEPNEWLPASDLQCGAKPARPAHSAFGETSDCEGVADASEALDTALRSNLAAYLAEQGEFSAFTLLYTPTVGGCDPGVAEYLVVLTQTAE